MLKKGIIPLYFAVAVLLFATIKSFGAQAKDEKKPQKTMLVHAFVTPDGKPTKTLLDLLAKTNVKHDGTLASIKAATQEPGLWKRPEGLEREESPEIFAKLRADLIPLFRDLGLLDDIMPKQEVYSDAIVLSNMVQSFRSRLAFAYALSKKGIVFKRLHLVGSERPLHKKYENKAALQDRSNKELPIAKEWQETDELPTTDTAMLKFVYDQADLSRAFRTIPCIVLNVEDQNRPDGTKARAQTGAQVLEWLKENGTKGTTLWFSDQPYVAYQDAVVQTYVPQSMHAETVGPKIDENVDNINLRCLDTAARIIYQENMRLTKEAEAQSKK